MHLGVTAVWAHVFSAFNSSVGGHAGVLLLLTGEVAAALPQLASMGCHGGIRSLGCWDLHGSPAESSSDRHQHQLSS